MNIVLTGGHSGIGLELSKMLLKDGHKLGFIIRNETRKQDANKALDSDNIDFFYADLSNQESVRNVAKELKASWTHIDGLFNNAGVLLDDIYTSSQDNEMHYEVNLLSPYILTLQLKPLLDKASKSFVINTVTGGLNMQKSLNVDELIKPSKFVKLFGSYLKSKLALTLIMNDLAKEDTWSTVRIINVDPGPNKTKMTQGNSVPFWIIPFRYLLFKTPVVGAKKLYNAAFSEQLQEETGIYIANNKKKTLKFTLTEEEKAKVLSGIM